MDAGSASSIGGTISFSNGSVRSTLGARSGSRPAAGLASRCEVLPTIAKRLGERLAFDVIAPELTPYGYQLVGADRCGIQGRSGAHIVYRSPSDGEMLSVFSVARMAEMTPDGLTRLAGRDFFLDTDTQPNVIAWHEASETHVVCAKLAPSRLLQIAGNVRTAMAKPALAGHARLASLKMP